MYYTTDYQSPVGLLTLASDGKSITGLWIEGQKYFADTVSDPILRDNLPVFSLAKEWLDQYFAGKEPFIFGVSCKTFLQYLFLIANTNDDGHRIQEKDAK